MAQQTPTELKEVIAAERTGYPFLVWRTDGGEQRLLLLDRSNWRVTIGRDAAADVPLPWDAEVSRTHALLEQVGRGWMLDRRRAVAQRVVREWHPHRRAPAPVRQGPAGVRRHRGHLSGDVGRHDPDRLGDRRPSAIPLSPMQRKVLIALCRPVQDSASATPATNRQISEDVFLTVDAVKAHLRVLFDRYGLSQLPQNEKRARLVAIVLEAGVLVPRDF